MQTNPQIDSLGNTKNIFSHIFLLRASYSRFHWVYSSLFDNFKSASLPNYYILHSDDLCFDLNWIYAIVFWFLLPLLVYMNNVIWKLPLFILLLVIDFLKLHLIFENRNTTVSPTDLFISFCFKVRILYLITYEYLEF